MHPLPGHGRTYYGATPIGGGVKWRPDLNGGLFGGAELAAGRNGGAKWRREKDELAAGEMAAPNWRRRNGGAELAACQNGGVKTDPYKTSCATTAAPSRKSP